VEEGDEELRWEGHFGGCDGMRIGGMYVRAERSAALASMGCW
jgi:hypothetical protein